MTAPYTKDWESYSAPNEELQKLLQIPVYRDFKMVKEDTTPASIRAKYVGRLKSDPWPGVQERDILIPVRDGAENPARLYFPGPIDGEEVKEPKGRPLLVMAFGGGFVIGTLESEQNHCRSWVKEHGGVAVSISYRLAPENPWPIPLNDIYDAVIWLSTNHASLDVGADPSQGFVVGGASSGATAMATVSHLWRDENRSPKLTGVYLSIPAPCIISALPEKYRGLEKAWEQNKDAPLFGRASSDWLISHAKPSPDDPLRSPLLFATGHKDLPPTYFLIAGADPWRDSGLIYEQVLREENGVRTKVDIFPGLPHGFWAFTPTAGFTKVYGEKSAEGFAWLARQGKD